MSAWWLHGLAGMAVFCIGLQGLLAGRHLLRRILALNFMSSGVFMFIVAMAHRNPEGPPDPVPHSIVLTGIVVAVSFTAIMLAFAVRLNAETGAEGLPEFRDDKTEPTP